MEELIKISKSEAGIDVVSARELYEFLGASERFSAWFNRQLSYGFNEGSDYVGCKVFNTLANQELDDFAITIDVAKEISMIQRSEKGKEARQYFIRREKELRQIESSVKTPQTYLEAIKEVVRLEEARLELESKIQQDAPKVEMFDKLMDSGQNITVAQFAKTVGVGPIKMFELLRAHKVLMYGGTRHNQPYQDFISRGYFEVKETVVGPRNNPKPHFQTFVTPKGQEWLAKRFV